MTDQRDTQSSSVRTGLIIAAALAAALIVWLLVSGGDDEPDAPSEPLAAAGSALPAQEPTAISVEELRELGTKQVIYWAGEQPGTKLEFEVTETGNVFVRYLDEEAEIGTKDQDYLTVGTYPADQAYELLQAQAKKTGAQTEEIADGGLVMVLEGQPQSVYVAFSGTNYQVEVYDPDEDEALDLALSEQLEPVS